MQSPPPPPAARSHRHDLDGLRGVAIALVVGYHVWVGKVSGGVDVFLTLSGFFLATTLLSRTVRLGDAGFTETVRSLLSAWMRIARRLLPSAIVVLAGVSLATVALLPRLRWEEIAKQVLASATYVENRHLAANELDYEAAGLAVSPVQHFWSLSVQGQLFLVVPAASLLGWWLVRRIRPGASPRAVLATLFGAVALASFGWALHAVSTDQSVAYYDTVARTWEILAGGLIALLLPVMAAYALRVPALLRAVLGHLALVAILLCGVLIDGARLFPGWATLWPVLATLLVVVVGTVPTRYGVALLLASRPARWLGDHAYTFYLWHWPVLILYLQYRGQSQVGWRGGAGVMALALVLAVLTKRLVEDPARSGIRAGLSRTSPPAGRWRASTAVVATTLGLLVVAGGCTRYLATVEHDRKVLDTLQGTLGSGQYPGAQALAPGVDPDSVPEAALVPALELARGDRPVIGDACTAAASPATYNRCTLHAAPGSTRVVVVGGSHSRQHSDVLRAVAQRHGFTLEGRFKLGCPLGDYRPRSPDGEPTDCQQAGHTLISDLLRDPPTLVIGTITRFWQPGSEPDRIPRSYVEAYLELAEAGIPLVLLRDNPGFASPVPQCVERHLHAGRAEVNRQCGMPRDQVLATDLIYPPVLAAHGARFIDLSDALCRPDWCNVIEGNVLVYRDRHHLTGSYARTMTDAWDCQLGRATGWWEPTC